MYQRHARPAMGLIGRPLTQEITSISNASHRPFHLSSTLSQDSNSNDTPPPEKAPAPTTTRAARTSNAIHRITSLNSAPPPRGYTGLVGGLREGRFKSGQHLHPNPSNPNLAGNEFGLQRPPIRVQSGPFSGVVSPRTQSEGSKAIAPRMPPQGAKVITPRTPRTPPEGSKFVRAPNTLRITRVGAGEVVPAGMSASEGGPRLRTRNRPGGVIRTDQAKRRDNGRDKKGQDKVDNKRDDNMDDEIEDLSDGMVLQLARLQQTAWEPKVYEPMYGADGHAGEDLVEMGKRLVEGEAPIRGAYEITEKGRAEGSKKEELWIGTAARGVQTNSSYPISGRDKFLKTVEQVMGV